MTHKLLLPLALLAITGLIVSIAGCTKPAISSLKKPIINPADLDTTVKPGDDFHGYANGGWMKRTPLPPDRSRFGTFDELAQAAQKQVQSLIDDIAAGQFPNDPIAAKIALFYKTGMDEQKIEALGLTPIKPWLERIDALKNKQMLPTLLADFHRSGFSGFFSIYADQDGKNSARVITQLNQSGLTLGDRDYYLEESEKMATLRSAYLAHINRMFRLTGQTSDAEAILGLEKALAEISMDRNDLRDPHKTYNKMDLTGLNALTPDFDWSLYFEGLNLSPKEINVGQVEFFRAMGKIIAESSPDSLKAYLKWHLITSSAPYLSKALVDENFQFFGKIYAGQQEIQPRWKRVLRATDSALSEAVGKLYVNRHFPPQAKERMLKLVENLRLALGERIDQLAWMSEETKAKAQEKLQTIRVKIGYPDQWRDYASLEVNGDGYFENVGQGHRFNFDFLMGQIDKPVDPGIWGMPPQMVNAYYSPSMNEICFPAAILQPPFFYMDGDDAVNYGAIGVVIGHEMTHGFDDQGRLYDKIGNLSNWWSDEDNRRFADRAEVLVKQFDTYDVAPGLKADGRFTLGENIADLGGLNIAFTAVKRAWAEKKPAEKLEGFTPQQRFFLGYAHLWAQNIADQEITRRTKTDPHSLGRFRVIGPLRNLPEFHQAFDIKAGDYMFLTEGERAVIW
jgi:putative endopeptidase